ncbi:MAG: AI-2E family transporter [Candidatus Obscuribacterales bacterium]|nr:AI-2E family transporter [Candidatus Obscuribacterales bacterium]
MSVVKEVKDHWRQAFPVFLFFGILLSLIFIYVMRGLIVNLLIAITLAAGIAPVAEWAEKRGIPRIVTIVLLYMGFGLVYAALAYFLAPALWEQAAQLYENVPHQMAGLTTWYNQLLTMAGQTPDALSLEWTDFRDPVLKMVKQTLSLTTGLVGLMLSFILILFLTAYFVIEANQIWKGLLSWLPKHRRERAASLIVPLGNCMGGYVRGQILVSICVGLFLGTGLSLLGVHYALVLGALAGVLNLMPFVGSMLTASFAVVVAFNQDPMLGLMTIGLFVLEQWVESNIIVPQLLGKAVDVHPVIILFAILIGASLMGVMGALVAVPVVAASLYLADEFYVKPLNE